MRPHRRVWVGASESILRAACQQPRALPISWFNAAETHTLRSRPRDKSRRIALAREVIKARVVIIGGHLWEEITRENVVPVESADGAAADAAQIVVGVARAERLLVLERPPAELRVPVLVLELRALPRQPVLGADGVAPQQLLQQRRWVRLRLRPSRLLQQHDLQESLFRPLRQPVHLVRQRHHDRRAEHQVLPRRQESVHVRLREQTQLLVRVEREPEQQQWLHANRCEIEFRYQSQSIVPRWRAQKSQCSTSSVAQSRARSIAERIIWEKWRLWSKRQLLRCTNASLLRFRLFFSSDFRWLFSAQCYMIFTLLFPERKREDVVALATELK